MGGMRRVLSGFDSDIWVTGLIGVCILVRGCGGLFWWDASSAVRLKNARSLKGDGTSVEFKTID